MTIRKAKTEELDTVMAIYAHGREIMKRIGNVHQWGNTRPARETIANDIREGNLYVVETETGVHASFAFLLGDDPTYAEIDGAWLNDNPYGTLHRIASDEEVKGVMREIVAFAESNTGDVRIDTHRDNKIMRHIVSKLGFAECGIIITDDGTERLAFQKHVR